MAVNTWTARRKMMRDTWTRCRTAHAGGDAVHRFDVVRVGTGDMIPGDIPGWWFLPPRVKMSWRDYRTYLRLALWTGIVRRTVDGLIGTLFREEPAHNCPDQLAGDVTGRGRNIVQFAGDAARELLVTGQVNILIDIPDGALRPAATILPAETIIGVRSEPGPDGWKPTVVRVQSEAELPDPKDEWSSKTVDQISVLRADGGKPYRVEVWRAEKPKKQPEGSILGPDGRKMQIGEPEWKLEETRAVMLAGRSLPDIPIVCGYIEDTDAGEPQPPISGLVDLNTDHYRARAAQAFAIHSIMPTLVVTGSSIQKSTLDRMALGNGNSVLAFTDAAAKAEVVGLGGDLSAVQKRIEDTETLIARMGSRTLMDQQRAGVEAAETVRLRQTGEASTLTALAECVDKVMVEVIGRMTDLDGSGGKTAEFALDRTALSSDPARIESLIGLFELNVIPRTMLLAELQRMHVIPDDVSPEEIDALIKAQMPKMLESDEDEDEDDEGDDDKKDAPPGGGKSDS